MPKLNISFFQFTPKFNSILENLTSVKALIETNQKQIFESDLVVFPEYFLSGSIDLTNFEDYKNQLVNINPILILEEITKEFPNTTFIFGSIILPDLDTYKNTSLVIKNGIQITKYSKKALIYNENYTCKSDSQYPVFEINGIKIGVAICWDLILPEVFRKYTSKVDLVVIPSFWGIGGNALQTKYSHSIEKTYYRQLLTTRAYENSFATLFVNSVGQYKSPFYSDRMMGGSLAVMPPQGEVFFTNSKKPQELHSIILDFGELAKYREFYATDQDYFFYKSKEIF